MKIGWFLTVFSDFKSFVAFLNLIKNLFWILSRLCYFEYGTNNTQTYSIWRNILCS